MKRVMVFAVTFLLMVSALWAQGVPSSADGQERALDEFTVGAYYWEDFTFPLDDVIPWEEVDVLYYSFAIPDYEKQDGTLLPLHYPEKLREMVDKGHAGGVQVMLSVGGYYYQNIYLRQVFEKIAGDPARREVLVDELMKLVDFYDLDGIDMDWEYPNAASAKSFEALMSELSSRLSPEGKLLSAAVIGRTDTANAADAITDETIRHIDRINVMCYDYKKDQNHSPMSFAEQSLAYWTSRAPKEKVILGVPFYARPSWQQYRLLVDADPANAVIDFVPDPGGNAALNSSYNGMPHMERKTMLALEKAGGIFGWEINEDAKGEYSLLSVIHRTVEGYRQGYRHTVSVVVNRNMVDFNDALGQPFLDANSRIMVPARKLGEICGAEVRYDDVSREAQVQLGGNVLRMPLQQKYFFRNDEKVEMDTRSAVVQGRVYLPVRAFFESLGYEVTWDGTTKTAYADAK